jgi:hypothetical protein
MHERNDCFPAGSRAWRPRRPRGRSGFRVLGAVASAGIIGFAFGARASDAGLHQLAVILTAASAVLLAGILADRDLRHRVMTTTSAQPSPAKRPPAAAVRAPAR